MAIKVSGTDVIDNSRGLKNIASVDATTATAISAAGVGGIDYVVKTANYTTQSAEGVLADTTSGAFTVTLPASPSTGDYVIVADPSGNWGTNNLTVGRNGSTIADVAQDLTCDIAGASVELVYDGTTWAVYAQIGGNGGTAVTLDGTQTLTNKTMSGSSNTFSNISLTAAVTGTLPPANGGTGLSSPGTSGNILTSNGSAWVSSAPAGGGVSGINYQVFTSSGTYTPTSGYSYAVAYVTGAGGGGGAGDTNWAGGGGGSGGTSIQAFDLSGVTTLTVTVGSGGSGGSGSTGSAGGNSSLSGTGITTMTGNGGLGGTYDRTTTSVTDGGSASGGDYNITGNGGVLGPPNVSGSTNSGGTGGASFWGGAAAGKWDSTSSAGVTGSGGAGGGYNTAGSSGGNGVVVIAEYK